MLLSEIVKTLPPFSDEEGAALLRMKEYPWQGRISFVVLGKDEKSDYHYSDQPCHGALARQSGFPGSVAVATFWDNSAAHNPTTEPLTDDEVRTFLAWYGNSLYRPFLLNPDTMFSDRFVAVTAKMYFPTMNCLNIINRTIYEKPAKVKMFSHLVNEGVPGDVAFLLSFSTTLGHGKFRDGADKIYKTSIFFEQSHTPLTFLNRTIVENFFSRNLPGYDTDPSRRMSKGSTSYWGGVNTFGQAGGENILLSFKKEEKKTSFKNPFSQADVASSRPSVDNLPYIIEGLVAIYNEVKK